VNVPAPPLDLAEAIDTLLVRGPAPSEHLRYLDIPGATVAVSAASAHPNGNRVGLTDVTPDDADALIRRVLAEFRALGHGLQWFVTPRSRPHDLAQRLEAHGLTLRRDAGMVGMARSTTAAAIDAPPSADVRSVELADIRSHARIVAEGFGMPMEACLDMLDRFGAGAVSDAVMLHYLAFEGSEAVGYASTLVDHARRVTLLGGSAVLAPHRGRGLYRALVRARSDDARRLGSEAVVVHANRATSAPILAGLGFEEVMEIAVYVLEPPGASTPV
jgi:GNAT superfamily N-acetyltransferase